MRTRPRAIPLAMITMRKSVDEFPLLGLYGMVLRYWQHRVETGNSARSKIINSVGRGKYDTEISLYSCIYASLIFYHRNISQQNNYHCVQLLVFSNERNLSFGTFLTGKLAFNCWLNNLFNCELVFLAREFQFIVLCSWARHFTLTVTHSNQGYKCSLRNRFVQPHECWGEGNYVIQWGGVCHWMEREMK